MLLIENVTLVSTSEQVSVIVTNNDNGETTLSIYKPNKTRLFGNSVAAIALSESQRKELKQYL